MTTPNISKMTQEQRQLIHNSSYSMTRLIGDVAEFHTAFGHPVVTHPSVPDPKRKSLREKLVTEEYGEFIEALNADDLEGLSDAIADLVYVLLGTALEYGIPLAMIWGEVQRANMAKRGGAICPETGKKLKPEGWTPPNIALILKMYSEQGT